MCPCSRTASQLKTELLNDILTDQLLHTVTFPSYLPGLADVEVERLQCLPIVQLNKFTAETKKRGQTHIQPSRRLLQENKTHNSCIKIIHL